jgi:hypothetical protein
MMKKGLLLICLFVLSISLVSCSKAKEKEVQPEKKIYEGYISLDGNKLIVDDFEFITADDTEKIKELGLSDIDMPSGHYIHNVSEEVKTFTLDDKTSYMFYDLGNLFVKEEDDKKYTTLSLDEFRTFVYGDKDEPRRTPFEIEVVGEKVISIKEIFVN